MKRALIFVLMVLCLPGLVMTVARADPLQAVTKRLIKGLDPFKTKRIAVLSFPYHNGDISSGSSIVSERLTTLIVERGGTEVVERALMDKAMGEIRLGLTGAIDPATTQKLGKMLGVSAIVTGTLIDLEDRVTEVNARLIQTETGEILAAAMSRIERTWTDLPTPPRPAVETRAPEEPEGTVHMSKLIPTSSPRRRYVPPIYTGPMQPLEPVKPGEPEQALTLTNDDLIPLNHRGNTDPEGIVDQFLSDSGKPPDYAVRMARRIYHRNPDPRVRGRALLAMGHILERSGRPGMAVQAYEQALREFPEAPAIQTEARQRLGRIDPRR